MLDNYNVEYLFLLSLLFLLHFFLLEDFMNTYVKPRYNQITLKANRDLVSRIRQIAKQEERSIQTVTNRLLRQAIKEYDNNNHTTDDFVGSQFEY